MRKGITRPWVQAGVAHVKLGYWHWQPDTPYWTQLDEVRGFMEGFQALSEKYGVKTVIHNHSGASMGLNACAAMNIVKDCDPQYVGVFRRPRAFVTVRRADCHGLRHRALALVFARS